METFPSGQQWTIRHGDQEAVVVEVGGGLRSYRRGQRDVVAGYDAGEQARKGRGQLLMPWPNRLRDGQYSFQGTEHQLALSEPEHHNAIHGLVRWALWRLVEQEESRVTVGHWLHPQQGWAGHLEIRVTYTLADDGLTVDTTVTNTGTSSAPFGYGAHPYLAIGETPLDSVQLQVPARTELLVDDRLIPCGQRPVEEGEHDFRSPRAVASADIDAGFTDLERDDDGRWRVVLSGLDAAPPVSLWADEAFGYTQVFTQLAAEAGGNGLRGIAVEPMSCPADAFNSGAGLVVLEPGDSWRGAWGVGEG